MRYKLIILWETGEREEYIYDSKTTAIEAQKGYRLAFGNQIAWTAIDTTSQYEPTVI